jgi:hypothetical protein
MKANRQLHASRPSYLSVKIVYDALNRWLGGPRACLDEFLKRNINWSCSGIEANSLDCPAEALWLNLLGYFLLCFVDRASRFMRVMKPTWCTIYLQFIPSLYLYMFRLASCSSSGGNNVYMWQLVRVVRFGWLSAGLVVYSDGINWR